VGLLARGCSANRESRPLAAGRGDAAPPERYHQQQQQSCAHSITDRDLGVVNQMSCDMRAQLLGHVCVVKPGFRDKQSDLQYACSNHTQESKDK
jgi:hypothetical protein